MFPPFLTDAGLRRRNIFAYIDVRDLGRMVQRCLETDGLGYEVFNVANPDMSVAAASAARAAAPTSRPARACNGTFLFCGSCSSALPLALACA